MTATRKRLPSFRQPFNPAAAALALLLAAGSPAGAAPDAKASKYYEDALTRFEKRDIAGSIVQLKNALQIDKTMLPVQVLLGKALLLNGEAVAAEVALREALNLGVDRAEVVVTLAQAYIAQGKQALVLEQPQFSPAGLPPAVQMSLLLTRSSCSADLGDPRAAMKAIDEARSINAEAVEVWLAEVPVRIRGRQFDQARDAAARALTLAPNSPDAWYQKASVLHVLGDLRGAIEAYDRALALAPAHVEARVARAGLQLDLGRADRAASDVAELRRLSPREPRGAYLAALLADRANKPAEARSALAQVTALIDPVPLEFIRYRPQLLLLNGMAHFGLNEREKAKPYLESFQKAQGNTAASKLLAQIYLAEPNVPRAIEVLEGYLKSQPGDAQAMTLLAGAHMSQGRHAKATAVMQEALRARDTPSVRTALGLSLMGGGQGDNALVQLEAAFAKDPAQTQAGTALVGLYLRGGQTAKAVAVAERLVQRQPANPGLFNLLGMARGQAGNVQGARDAYAQALQLDPALVGVKINLARLEVATQAYDQAAARLGEVLKADEKNVDALYEMAVLSQRRGQLPETQRWLEKASDHAGPRELRPGLALVNFQLHAGRGGPALDAAKQLYAKAPDDVPVLLAYASAQLAHRDNAAARTTLTTATRLADFNAPLQTDIARLQLAAGNLPGAAYSLEKGLSDQPDFLPAGALLTEVELRQGELAKAEQRARRIAEKYPRRAIGFSLLGDVAAARGQSGAALEAYRKAHQAEPGTETMLRLYRALSLQDAIKAGALADEWLRAHPQDGVVRKALADGQARSRNYAAARLNYEAALKAQPDDSEVMNNLANVLLRLKDPGAAAMAEQALARSPGDVNVIDTLGWALFQAGQRDRALPFLRDARLRDPANPEIRFHLGSVLADAGRSSEAREELDAALKSGRPFEGSAQAQRLLASLR